MLAGEDKPSFSTPGVVCNSDGWGPISIPEQFKDIPYQPFSKSDNLGQVCSHNFKKLFSKVQ